MFLCRDAANNPWRGRGLSHTRRHPMRTRLFALLLSGWLVLFVSAGRASAVEIGTARVNVIQELGVPKSAIARGDDEKLTYKDGTVIELRSGKVVAIKGLAPATKDESVAPEKPEPEKPAVTKPQESELEQAEKAWSEADAKAREQMEKSIASLEGGATPDHSPLAQHTFTVVSFVVGLVLKGLITLAALKLSCKYWNSDVPWSGLLIVTAADIAVRGVIEFVGVKLLQMYSLFYADEAVAALVMVMLLRKVSINQRLTLAIEVTITVKTFTIIVGSFLVTVALRLLA